MGIRRLLAPLLVCSVALGGCRSRAERREPEPNPTRPAITPTAAAPLVGPLTIRRACTHGGMTRPADGALTGSAQLVEADGTVRLIQYFSRRPARERSLHLAPPRLEQLRPLAAALWSEPDAPRISAHDAAGCSLTLSANGAERRWYSPRGREAPALRALGLALEALDGSP
jgi:hypothetical protein